MIDPLSVFLLLPAAATPILFAALGELVVERAGVLNLGVEGMMITGALAGFAAAYVTGSPFAGWNRNKGRMDLNVQDLQASPRPLDSPKPLGNHPL